MRAAALQQALLAHTCGNETDALDELAGQVRQLMPLMLRRP